MPWYNEQHRHSGIGLYAPADVHFGQMPRLDLANAAVLAGAYAAHPERFVRGQPRPPELSTAVWINPPREVVPPQ